MFHKSGFILFAVCVFCTLPCAERAFALPSYSDVLLIVNDDSRNSIEIGNFFSQRRNIPAKNIFHIHIDTSQFPQLGETIDSATFKEQVWLPLENYMQANNLVDSINYIVTTKGCPLRITTFDDDDYNDTLDDTTFYSGLASFNDCLALINGSDSIYVLTQKIGDFAYSRYFRSQSHFKHNQDTMPYYLTTRLDGYTVSQIESYIVKAESTAVIGEGLTVLDEDPSKTGDYISGNQWMAEAFSEMQPLGFNVLLNVDSVYITNQQNVIAYTSWGSNDNYANDYTANAIPHNTYLNGSIGETYVSTSARSFNAGTPYDPQSLIADWIAEGISAMKGYTDEPYLIALAEPNILFPLYMSGFNMAESYWAASPLIAWRQVVIGDPKMTLQPVFTTAADTVNFGICQRYSSVDTQIVMYNASAAPITISSPLNSSGSLSPINAGIFRNYPLPHIMNPGDSLVMTASFTPITFDTIRDTVNIPYTVPNNPHSLLLQTVFTGTASLMKYVTKALPAPFGSVYIGDSSEGDFSFTNNTNHDTLIITKLGMSDPVDFFIAPLGSGDSIFVLPGQTINLPVLFTPRDTGELLAHLEPLFNAPIADVNKYIGLDGFSLITFGFANSRFGGISHSLNFGVRQRHVLIDTQIVMYNAIDSPMALLQPWNSGDTLHQIIASLFNPPSFPLTLNPEDSLHLQITCDPDSIEGIMDTLNVPYYVIGNLNQKLFQEGFSCTPSLLKFVNITNPAPFSNVQIGDTVKGNFIFLNTTAHDSLILTHIAVSDSENFHVSSINLADTVTVLPGRIYNVPVLFTPRDTSPHAAHLVMSVNTSPQDVQTYIGVNDDSVKVAGKGVSPFSSSSGNVDFGICQRYAAIDTQYIIHNVSGMPITIDKPLNSGDSLNQITASIVSQSPFPLTFQQGDSLIVMVSCSPEKIGTMTDTFTIPYHLPGQTQTLLYSAKLRGTASLMDFVAVSTPGIFSGVPAGDSAKAYFTFQNNTLKDSVILDSIGISDSRDFFVPDMNISAPIIILPGQTDSIPVWFTPHDTGEFQGHLSLSVMNTTEQDEAAYIGMDGSFLIVTGISGLSTAVRAALPMQSSSFTLAQNFPNPFTNATEITYSIPEPAPVTITVYDALGRTMTNLAAGLESAGFHAVSLNSRNFPAGVYYYVVTAGKNIGAKMMQVIK